MIELKQLEAWLIEGKTTREIENMTGVGSRMVSWYAKKYNLSHLFKYKKNPNFEFTKIDTKEKAYAIGFIACDGHIDFENQVSVRIQKSDREILDYMASYIHSNVMVSDTTNIEQRRYPYVTISKCIKDITKFLGGRLKVDRHLPIVPRDLNRYLLLGAFDADGCVTFGRRKDRDRFWQKVSFTSQLGILTSIQNILFKECGISTIIRPKSEEDCYVLEFSNKDHVLKFINYIYPDNFFVSGRKFKKAAQLRLELEEFGGREIYTEPSL